MPCPYQAHLIRPSQACLATVAAPALRPCTSAGAELAVVVAVAVVAGGVPPVHQIHLLLANQVDSLNSQCPLRNLEEDSLHPSAHRGFVCVFRFWSVNSVR